MDLVNEFSPLMSIASTGEYETPNSINGFDEAPGEIINLNSATHSSNGLNNNNNTLGPATIAQKV
jgi:hypothetical protein